MCTLAILSGEKGGYLLGHNRDESVRRAAGLPPSESVRDRRSFLAPRDPEGGGSWIGVNDEGVTFALLNAAHADPGRLPERPPTRGRLLDAVVAITNPDAVRLALGSDEELFSTKGFHLVMVIPGTPAGPASAIRLRWDGFSLDADEHDLPVLFVSSGFDQAGAEEARGASWRRFLERGDRSGAALRAWLAGHEPERGVLSACMHGDVASTVSSILVDVTADRARMLYHAGAPCDESAADHEAEIGRRPHD